MEELIFRTKVDSGKAVKETEQLTDVLKGTGDAAIDAGEKGAAALAKLNKQVEDGNYTFAEANGLIAKYIEIAQLAGEQTPVGKEAIRIADGLAEAIDRIGDSSLKSKEQAHGLEAALDVSKAIVGTYGAIEGAQALLGNESEALTETLVKLQAIESILKGLEEARTKLAKDGVAVTKLKAVWSKAAAAAEYIYAAAVGTTTGAMKALRIAMMAIPLIAIIALIVAAVQALASFFSAAEVAEEQNNALNASFEKQNAILEANTRAFRRNSDNKRKLMVSEDATAEELFEHDKRRLEGEEVLRKKNLNLLKVVIPEKTKVYKQALAEENWELAKTIREETQQIRNKYQEFKELDGQYAVDRTLLEREYRKEISKQAEADEKERQRKSREYAQKAKAAREEQQKKQLEEQRLFEDLLLLNIKDEQDRKLAQLKLAHKRELEELVQKYGADSRVIAEAEKKQLDEYYELLEDFRLARDKANEEEEAKKQAAAQAASEALRRSEKAELEGKLIQMREDAETVLELEKELALFAMEEALLQENLTEGEKFKIRQEYAARIDELNAQVVDKELKRQKDLVEATRTTTEMGLEAAQGLADAFFDYKIEKAEKGSEAELRAEKRKFEVNKKLQIAQAIMQGIQGVQAAYSSGSAIPIVGAVTGPAFAVAAGVTSALNVARIRNTTFEGGGASTAASTSAPTVSVPSVQGQESDNVTTQTQGLPETNTTLTKVVLLQSELDLAASDNAQVDVVSNVGG